MPAISITSIGGGDSIVSAAPGDNLVVGTAQPGYDVVVRRGNTALGVATPDSNGNFSYALTPDNLKTIGQGTGKTINVRQLLATDAFTFAVNTTAPLPPPLPTLGISVTSTSIPEGTTASSVHTFTVTRSGATSASSSVAWAVTGSGSNPANAADFGGALPSGSLAFAPGETLKSIRITVSPDATNEADEGFTVTLSSPSGAVIGTSSANGVIVNDDASVTPPPPPIPTAPTFGWTVNARNIGLAAYSIDGSTLPIYNGPDNIPANTTISQMRFIKPISCHLGGIVLDRCMFQPTPSTVARGLPLINTFDLSGSNSSPTPTKVIIRDSEFDGSLVGTELAAWATGFWGCADLLRNYAHHLGGGFALLNTGTQLDALVEHNYTVNLQGWGNPATTGNHSDAFTIRDFTNAVKPDRQAIIRNNRFICDSPNATSAFFMQASAGRIDNIPISGNLLEGFAWTFGLEANANGYSNVSMNNNRFNPTLGSSYGNYYVTGGPGFSSFAENYKYDPAGADGKGAPVT